MEWVWWSTFLFANKKIITKGQASKGRLGFFVLQNQLDLTFHYSNCELDDTNFLLEGKKWFFDIYYMDVMYMGTETWKLCAVPRLKTKTF